eukprot:GHVU01189246.1.p1 GENE.GHVU01189246.1~~GHVU01189246.1.p1  ORF type:complete len:136 (+),score=4.72 GHVU01189246.1:218-625(+)
MQTPIGGHHQIDGGAPDACMHACTYASMCVCLLSGMVIESLGHFFSSRFETTTGEVGGRDGAKTRMLSFSLSPFLLLVPVDCPVAAFILLPLEADQARTTCLSVRTPDGVCGPHVATSGSNGERTGKPNWAAIGD